MAVMADFARLPTRRKVLVFVLIGLVLGAVYYEAFFKPLDRNVTDARNARDAKVALDKRLDGEIPAFRKLKLQYGDLKRRLNAEVKALPTAAELPAFFDMLNRKVLESGVEVKTSERMKEVRVDSFIKVPVKFVITGTFLQIEKFFASLLPPRDGDEGGDADATGAEASQRIVSIENLSLKQPQVIDHQLVLTANFVADTYREVQPKRKPGAPPRVTVPARRTTKPLPPANTPRGAKLRVQHAMHEEKTRPANAVRKLNGGL